jgi:hypothetical protein
LFRDVDEKHDLIATRDPASGDMSYAMAAFKIAKDYEGEMLEWSSTELNICVTPEHRVPFTYRDSPGKVHWQSADWLARHMGGHHYVDLLSSYAPPIPVPEKLEGLEPLNYAEFMGLYLSEGSVEKRRVTIYQAVRRPEMERILDATGLPWKWFCHGKTSGWRAWVSKSLAAHLRVLGTATTKRVSDELRYLPPTHARAFINSYTLGDGHVRTRKNGAVEHTLFTTSEGMAGDMQDIAQKAGWNSSVRKVKPQRSVYKGRTITNGGGFSVTFKKGAARAELLRKNFRRVPYNGKVYCLNVPHHTLYVRRGGKPSWNGNTPACSFSQVLPDGRWLIFDEMISEEMGIDRFSDEVLERCSRNFRGGVDFYDYGDPAGGERAETDEKTCFDIMRAKGIMIEPGLQTPAIRFESVRKPMRTLVGPDSVCQFVLHKRCKTIRKGFLGAYHFRRLSTNSERFSEKVNKNHPYSDVMNSVEYVATILFGAGLTETNRSDGPPAARPSEQGKSRVTGY